MYSSLKLASKYIHYYVTALNGKGHGIHSPFIFDFVNEVLNDKREFYSFQTIEALRQRMLSDQTQILVEDFGAGSVYEAGQQRSVASIAKNALKSPRLGQLLFRIVHYYNPHTIVELGTSLGLTSAYLASANSKSQLFTIEGAPAIAAIAKDNFQKLDLNNISLITGKFEDQLKPLLGKLGRVDFAFVDGNHRYQPTMEYFHALEAHSHENSFLIFDDIHWSSEMEQAWASIKNSPGVSATVDLFFLGIVIFRKEFREKRHFVIRY